MEINYVLSPSANTEDFIIKIYEAQAPTAEVATLTVPAPHTAPYAVSFTGLDKIPHILRMFGATTGNLLHFFDDLPTENVVNIFDDITFKIGDGQAGTPAAGDSSFVASSLIGLDKKDFNFFRNGTFYYPTLYSFDSPTGEIGLTYPDQFGDGEEVLITRKPKAVTTQVNDSVVGKQFGGNSTIPEMFIDVNTTVNYQPAHLRHLIRLSGASANYVLTGAIPIGYIFRVTNFGPYADPADKGKVTFSNAPLLWGNTTKTELDIQFTGTYEFEFDGTNWDCTMYNVAQETPAAQIVYATTAILGKMTTTDKLFTVTIPYMGVMPVSYLVVGNLLSLDDWNQDNDISFVIANRTSTSFDVSIKRYTSTSKTLGFMFVIVK